MLNRIVFSANHDRWSTDGEVYRKLNDEFNFDYDPCPLDGESDGRLPLFSSWKDRRVFCNPPYGPGIIDWIKRGPEADVAVFLLPARTDTKWFHWAIANASEIRFVFGRLKFGGAKQFAPFPSVIVVFNGNGEKRC